jgi:hypothetical protein
MNSPARPRGGFYDNTTRLQIQCILANSDARKDIPATKHCNFYFIPFLPLPLRL